MDGPDSQDPAGSRRARRADRRAAPAFWLAGPLLLAVTQGALAAPLVINANTSNPAPRAAWAAAIEAFQAENPGIEVSFNV
jgi:ABC-type glycerol-3-phosphate transport system substrate-binding protein